MVHEKSCSNLKCLCMPAGLWARSASIRTISCSCDKESGVAEAVAAAAAAAVEEAEEDWERLELDTRFTAMARSNFGEYFGLPRENGYCQF